MEQRLQSDPQGISNLVGEIVSDVQLLVRQEMALAKNEIKKDMVRGKNAAQLFAGAMVIFFFATGFGLLAIAQGMIAMGIPQGVTYGLLCLLLIGLGIASYELAKRWVKSMTLPMQTTDNLQENVQWLRKQIGSEKKSKTPAVT